MSVVELSECERNTIEVLSKCNKCDKVSGFLKYQEISFTFTDNFIINILREVLCFLFRAFDAQFKKIILLERS